MNRFGIRLAAGIAVVGLGGLAIFQAQSGKDAVTDGAWPSATSIASETPPAPLGVGAWPGPPDSGSEDTLVRGNDGSTPAANSAATADAVTNASGKHFGRGVQLASHDEPVKQPPLEGSAGDAPAGDGPADDELALDEPPYTAPPASFDFPQPLPPADGGGAAAETEASAGLSMPGQSQPAAAAPPASGGFANPLAMPGMAPPSTAPPTTAPASGNAMAAGAETPQDSSALELPEANAADDSAAAAPPAMGLRSEITLAPIGSGVSEPYTAHADAQPPASQMPAPLGGSAAAEGPGDALDVAASQWGQAGNPQPQEGDAAQEPTQPLATEADPPSLNDRPLGGAPSLTRPKSPPSLRSRGENSIATSPLDGPGAGIPGEYPDSAPRIASAAPLNGGLGGRLDTSSVGGSPLAVIQLFDPAEVLSEPGARGLEGAQAPSVVIQKRAPAEIRVGKPADFIISVRNVGTVDALDVRVFDSVPQGTQLVEAVPTPEAAQNALAWQLGDLKPGEERSITVKLLPQSEGEIGSVARVTFEAAASVRTRATQPAVHIEQRAPEQVLIGQQVEIEVELSNTGSGASDDLVLQADIPEGLEHPMGRQLDNLIGSMAPGDSRRQILRLRATAAGVIHNRIQLSGPDGVVAESDVEIEVIAPSLQVALDGPSLRYLERQTTYNVQIANTGTASASEIDLVAYLDRGLKFVSTDFEGQYDPNQHAVFWSLAELPAGQSGEVPLTLLPVEAGTQNVRLEAKADLGVAAESEKELAIETLAELTFSIADDQDPIETGAETLYEIRVQNKGSRDDTNVVLEVQLPHPAMELVSADPIAGTDGRGRVVFNPIASIPSKGEHVFHIRVRGTKADTHVIAATLKSDQSRKPVTKQESTTVYADE